MKKCKAGIESIRAEHLDNTGCSFIVRNRQLILLLLLGITNDNKNELITNTSAMSMMEKMSLFEDEATFWYIT